MSCDLLFFDKFSVLKRKYYSDITGGKIPVKSPKSITRNEKPQKVYILDNDSQSYSVHNNKHYRLLCQLTPGKIICMFLYMGLYCISLGELPFCGFKTCQQGRELSEKSQSDFTCRHIDLVRSSESCVPEKPIQVADVRWVKFQIYSRWAWLFNQLQITISRFLNF